MVKKISISMPDYLFNQIIELKGKKNRSEFIQELCSNSINKMAVSKND